MKRKWRVDSSSPVNKCCRRTLSRTVRLLRVPACGSRYLGGTPLFSLMNAGVRSISGKGVPRYSLPFWESFICKRVPLHGEIFPPNESNRIVEKRGFGTRHISGENHADLFFSFLFSCFLSCLTLPSRIENCQKLKRIGRNTLCFCMLSGSNIIDRSGRS